MRNYPQYFDELTQARRLIEDALPATTGNAGLMRSQVFAGGALASSHKELIALAMAIGSGCEACFTFQIPLALRAGASNREVEEAIAVAAFVGGEVGAHYGAMAMQALRQFDAHPKEWVTTSDSSRGAELGLGASTSGTQGSIPSQRLR